MSSQESVQPHEASGGPTLWDQAEMLRGFRYSFQAVHVIATGVQVGLFGHLAAHPQGMTYQELAQMTGFHAPYLRIWCSTAYRYQVLEADEYYRYRLAPHMDSLLAERSHPDSQAVIFVNNITLAGPQMVSQAEYIKSGEVSSHPKAYGSNPDRLDPPKNQETLHRRMWIDEMVTKAPQLEKTLNKGGRILDVGCGPGLLMLQLADLYPTASFVGIDVVEAGGLKTARRLIGERGFGGRITVEPMRAEEISFHEEFDGVVMTSVFHEILPVELREPVLRGCYGALKRPGVLLIRDSPYPGALEGFRDPLYQGGIWGQYTEMIWGTVHPTWEEQHGMLGRVGFSAVERHFLEGMPFGIHYLTVAHKL